MLLAPLPNCRHWPLLQLNREGAFTGRAEQGFESFLIGDGQGTLTAFEAPGPANVAWCSSLNIGGPTKALSSLTLW